MTIGLRSGVTPSALVSSDVDVDDRKIQIISSPISASFTMSGIELVHKRILLSAPVATGVVAPTSGVRLSNMLLTIDRQQREGGELTGSVSLRNRNIALANQASGMALHDSIGFIVGRLILDNPVNEGVIRITNSSIRIFNVLEVVVMVPLLAGSVHSPLTLRGRGVELDNQVPESELPVMRVFIKTLRIVLNTSAEGTVITSGVRIANLTFYSAKEGVVSQGIDFRRFSGYNLTVIERF